MIQKLDRYRDPIHGFIEVRPLENEIINSEPFQRLRNIKQLALTNFVIYIIGEIREKSRSLLS